MIDDEKQRDMEFVDAFKQQIKEILAKNTMHMTNITIANGDSDMLRATDFIVTVQDGTIAVRLRREGYAGKYQDLTIRSRRISGVETELQKIKNGFARWYLYGWTVRGLIKDWFLIDLDKVREYGILDKNWLEIPNKDSTTWFIAIPIKYLKKQNCIIAPHEPKRQYKLTDF